MGTLTHWPAQGLEMLEHSALRFSGMPWPRLAAAAMQLRTARSAVRATTRVFVAGGTSFPAAARWPPQYPVKLR
ncbi:hypothetical protein LNP25_28130 [Klebsiella variicola subsp. variicola]|nr:hypothetical protein [Klebsiella variicola subsp. variicola]